jgi:hypothetical protein
VLGGLRVVLRQPQPAVAAVQMCQPRCRHAPRCPSRPLPPPTCPQWSKLRAIEVLCNACPGQAVLRVVEDILYAPSQEEGERILTEAMAEIEAQGGGAAPAAAAEAAPAGEEGQQPVADEEAAAGGGGGLPAAEVVGCAA